MVAKGTKGDPVDIPTPPDAREPPRLSPTIPIKEKKTAEELAAMIHHDLSEIEGCPERGVSVTVYGLSPWNSLLTFGVDAGPVPNGADLQAFCEIITERLKRLYNIRHLIQIVPRAFAPRSPDREPGSGFNRPADINLNNGL